MFVQNSSVFIVLVHQPFDDNITQVKSVHYQSKFGNIRSTTHFLRCTIHTQSNLLIHKHSHTHIFMTIIVQSPTCT